MWYKIHIQVGRFGPKLSWLNRSLINEIRQMWMYGHNYTLTRNKCLSTNIAGYSFQSNMTISMVFLWSSPFAPYKKVRRSFWAEFVGRLSVLSVFRVAKINHKHHCRCERMTKNCRLYCHWLCVHIMLTLIGSGTFSTESYFGGVFWIFKKERINDYKKSTKTRPN